MGRIQSNVGLITGIPITDTVEQLISVAARPREILTRRTEGLQQEQLAINSLSSRLLSLKFDLGSLKVSTPFQSRSVTSSNEESLLATLAPEGKPPLGSFALRPAQTAGSQQLISQRFETLDDIQDVGSFSFGFGGFVDKGISLDDLNGGLGVARGEIKITDLAGNSSVVDLTLVRTVDDVLKAINNDPSLNLTATVNGDSFVLTDIVGGAGTLTVQEVAGGSTAADLGLAGITTTDASVTGNDIFRLHSGTKLIRLNDGNGVRTREGVDDLFFSLADGSTDLGVDLHNARSIGDVLDIINEDEALTGKISAAISADGNRLELTDLTAGGGTFTVTSGATGSAAEDLGLTNTASGGTITGQRLVSGLRDSLVSSLNGGKGATLGAITIFDRNGIDSTIDLSGAETLTEVIETINASSVDVTAKINAARNGITITDNTGGSDNLLIANADATNTADVLGIAIDAAEDSIDSGSLHRQTISEATLLSSLKGGEGIQPSDIRITDTTGQKVAIDLNSPDDAARTIGDVIDAINASKAAVEARINDTGDGIVIIDSGFGEEPLKIEDVNGTLAADLNLTRASETTEVDSVTTQVIDGRNSFDIDLSDLAASSSSISLSSLNDGTGITFSDIRITDTAGERLAFDLNGRFSNLTTINELIDAINSEANSAGVGITASINNTGTGILIADSANGTGKLKVEDINGTAAADLRILSTDATTTSINGSGLFAPQSASQGALQNVATKINNLEVGVTASVLNDGLGFRLQLVVNQTGAGNEILVSAADSGFVFSETSAARDALLVVGAGATPGSGVLVSSSTNEFADVIDGIDLTAVAASDTPVDVVIEKSDAELLDQIQSFVDSYNTLRDDLDELTSFNENDSTTGLLFGTTVALRVDTELSRLVTDRYSGLGSFQSLQEIGISVDESGKLEFDAEKLQKAFAEDSKSLQALFTNKDRGIVARFDAAIESLAGADNGLLTNRDKSLQSTIDSNETRIEQFNASLDRQRERLLLQFFQLEQVIAGMQSSQQALDSFQSIPPLTSTNFQR